MTDRPSKTVWDIRIRLCLLAGLALLLIPVTSLAESSNLLITADAESGITSLDAPGSRQLPVRQNSDDKFVIRCGDISFSVNYAGGEPADSLREQSGLLTPVKAVASLSNLTFKVGVAF